jgi:hypothetical protein
LASADADWRRSCAPTGWDAAAAVCASDVAAEAGTVDMSPVATVGAAGSVGRFVGESAAESGDDTAC